MAVTTSKMDAEKISAQDSKARSLPNMGFTRRSGVSWGLTALWLMYATYVPFGFLTYTYNAIVPLSLGALLLVALDFALLDTFPQNLKRFYANGYSDKYLLLSTVWNYFVAIGGAYPVFYLFIEGHDVWDVSWWTPLLVVMTLLMADATFTPSHKYILHHWKPQWHLLHHCCIKTTCACCFIADPIDVVFEFGFILMGTLGFSLLVCQSPVVLFWSLVVLYPWVFLDHDENISPPHYYHHKFTNSNYSFVVNVADKSSGDQVKHILDRSVKAG